MQEHEHDPIVSRSAVAGRLERISCELVTLKAWHEDGIISAREHGQQISTLLAAKLPMPVTHSELTRSVLEALATWSRDSLVWEDIAAASRAAVLRAAAGCLPPPSPPLSPPEGVAEQPDSAGINEAVARIVASAGSAPQQEEAVPTLGAGQAKPLSFGQHCEASGGKKPASFRLPQTILDSPCLATDHEPADSASTHDSVSPPKSSGSARTCDVLNNSFAAHRRRTMRFSNEKSPSAAGDDRRRMRFSNEKSPPPAAASSSWLQRALRHSHERSSTDTLPGGSSGKLTYSPATGSGGTLPEQGAGDGEEEQARLPASATRSRAARNSVEEINSHFARNRRGRVSTDGAEEVSTDLTDLVSMLEELRQEGQGKGHGLLNELGLGVTLRRAKTRTNFMMKATDILEQEQARSRSEQLGEASEMDSPSTDSTRFSFSKRGRRKTRGLSRRCCRALDRMVPVFEPESRLLTLWQLTIFAFVLVSAVVVPLMVAFEGEMPRGTRASLSTMDKVFDIAFIIDMLVSCNVAFREDGFVVRVRRLVAMKYARGWLALDFVSSFPLSWILEDGDGPADAIYDSTDSQASLEVAKINKLLRLVKLGKLLRILKLFKIFDMLANEMRFNPASFRLLGLAFGLFFIAHLFGCLWYMTISWSGGTLEEYQAFVEATATYGTGRAASLGAAAGDPSSNASTSSSASSASASASASAPFSSYYAHGSRYPLDELLAASKLGSDGVGHKWLLCFTWAIGLFTGLMPIEMHPWRSEEMAFCIVALVCAMAFNAMIISSCSSAMAAMDYVARHHKAKLDRVRDYMRFNNVPGELSTLILDYYKYICVNSQTKDDVKDFGDLPQQLHFKLVIALHRDLITKCPLFVEFDNNSILRILTFLRPFTLPPETVVLRQDHSHTAMYFVSRGMLWIVDITQRNADGTPLRVGNLGDHDFFGDEGVLSGRRPEYSVVTKSYCVLMALTRADFETANPRLKQHLASASSRAGGDAGRIMSIVEAIKRKRALTRVKTTDLVKAGMSPRGSDGRMQRTASRKSGPVGGGEGGGETSSMRVLGSRWRALPVARARQAATTTATAVDVAAAD